MATIRDANQNDVKAITRIYNDAVENTLAIWNDQLVSIENRSQWLETRQQSGFPVLVVEDVAVAGFASYGPFRPFEGYRFSAELSIYIDKTARGRGYGKKLLGALVEHASRTDIHVLIAGIEAANAISISLHKALGFEQTGYLPQVGFKKGQWLDLVFFQKTFPMKN